MNQTILGPRLSDKKFFTQLIDTTLPGMEGLEKAAQSEDYETCRKIFADRVRAYLQPELFQKLPSRGMDTLTNQMDKLVEAADRICENELSSCGHSWKFGETIDWTYNASPDGYVEWTWQLNRHPHWTTLAQAYEMTGNEKYAACFARQFTSWVRQAVAPEEELTCYGNQTLCWRSIECGLRMSGSFPTAFHAFYKSTLVSDDIIVDYYKSIWEHGQRLERFHSRFNWLTMEMNGLGHMALLYPELKDSAHWYQYVTDTLKKELKESFYADGFQGELSTVYQFIVISNYMEILKAAEVYHHPMPRELYDGVEKMLELLVKLAKPNLETPDIGDGHAVSLAKIIGPFADDFPQNQVLRWAATLRKEGKRPDYCSVELPYSGFAVMRTNWEENALYACFDGGPFGLCHQHQDKLNLVVYANGRFLIPECGTYAYDTSPIRRYAISTRGHNTARINGMDQNRQTFRINTPGEMETHSGIQTLFTEEMDYATAVYEDGYSNDYIETAFQAAVTLEGKLLDKDGHLLPDPSVLPKPYTGASHQRGVMMIKKPENGLKPFLLVFDHFKSNDENDYEIIWHLNTNQVFLNENLVGAEDFSLWTLKMPKDVAGQELVSGAWVPECQGWLANTMTQGAYQPIWTLKTLLHGTCPETVTLIYPEAPEHSPIAGLQMEHKTGSPTVLLQLKNGKTISYQEPVL